MDYALLDELSALGAWLWEQAWARHQNPLSWYIRPLFLIPFCYFAYQRRAGATLLTLAALLSSMAWFPVPQHLDPQIVEFLEFEKQWLAGEWTISKILMTLFVPVALFALAAAFWRRSLLLGIACLAAIMMIKIAWSVFYAGSAGQEVILPAVIGFVICICGVIIFLRHKKHAA